MNALLHKTKEILPSKTRPANGQSKSFCTSPATEQTIHGGAHLLLQPLAHPGPLESRGFHFLTFSVKSQLGQGA